MWSTNFITLVVLFIAFIDTSIAQKAAAAEREVVVAEGAPLTVECALRVEQRAEWRVDGAAPAPDMRAGERPAPAGAGVRARLHVPRARLAHAGLYTCGARSEPVRVRVLSEPEPEPEPSPAVSEGVPASSAEPPAGAAGAAGAEEEPLLRTLVSFKLYEPLSFNCSTAEAAGAVSRYQWYINGTLAEGLGAGKGPALEEGGAVLVIRRAHEDHWGNYTCRVGGAVAKAWQAEALSLARVPSDTNVVEGQAFSVTCRLIGKPYKPVSWWFRAGADRNATELAPAGETGESRVRARDSPAGVPGGVLEVRDAVPADAGEYLCRPAGPEPALREGGSVVRVKDVYAALWPFLGICLEVFVLCAIILVYEKRRTKPELDDSDADTHDQ